MRKLTLLVFIALALICSAFTWEGELDPNEFDNWELQSILPNPQGFNWVMIKNPDQDSPIDVVAMLVDNASNVLGYRYFKSGEPYGYFFDIAQQKYTRHEYTIEQRRTCIQCHSNKVAEKVKIQFGPIIPDVSDKGAIRQITWPETLADTENPTHEMEWFWYMIYGKYRILLPPTAAFIDGIEPDGVHRFTYRTFLLLYTLEAGDFAILVSYDMRPVALAFKRSTENSWTCYNYDSKGFPTLVSIEEQMLHIQEFDRNGFPDEGSI